MWRDGSSYTPEGVGGEREIVGSAWDYGVILHPELIPCPGDTWAWDYAAGDAHDQEDSFDSSEMTQSHILSEWRGV